jgi:hypothetical protein
MIAKSMNKKVHYKVLTIGRAIYLDVIKVNINKAFQ